MSTRSYYLAHNDKPHLVRGNTFTVRDRVAVLTCKGTETVPIEQLIDGTYTELVGDYAFSLSATNTQVIISLPGDYRIGAAVYPDTIVYFEEFDTSKRAKQGKRKGHIFNAVQPETVLSDSFVVEESPVIVRSRGLDDDVTILLRVGDATDGLNTSLYAHGKRAFLNATKDTIVLTTPGTYSRLVDATTGIVTYEEVGLPDTLTSETPVWSRPTAVTASNGLTASGTTSVDVKLGGTLTADTDLHLADKTLTLDGTLTSGPDTWSVAEEIQGLAYTHRRAPGASAYVGTAYLESISGAGTGGTVSVTTTKTLTNPTAGFQTVTSYTANDGEATSSVTLVSPSGTTTQAAYAYDGEVQSSITALDGGVGGSATIAVFADVAIGAVRILATHEVSIAGPMLGTATLVAGAVAVAYVGLTTNSVILLTTQSLGTVAAPKAIAVTAKTAGVGFTITSADNTDTSIIGFLIVENL